MGAQHRGDGSDTLVDHLSQPVKPNFRTVAHMTAAKSQKTAGCRSRRLCLLDHATARGRHGCRAAGSAAAGRAGDAATRRRVADRSAVAGVHSWCAWCAQHALPCLPAWAAEAAVGETMAGIRRAAAEAGRLPGKKLAATADILRRILEPIGTDLGDLRDRALRRAEFAAIRIEHLEPCERGLRLTLVPVRQHRTL